MDPMTLATKVFGHLDPRLVARIEPILKSVPAMKKLIEAQYDTLMKDLEAQLKPYREEFGTTPVLPSQGRSREDLLAEMKTIADRERSRWKDGFASGAVYHGDEAHVAFMNEVYGLYSQSNPLHSDLWPSSSRYEAEIVSMVAHMLGGGEASDTVCGSVTSGGTESILLAMKTYRDQARAERRERHPEVVLPVTAHVAFDKACQYFNIKKVSIPVDADGRANVRAAKNAITSHTIALVGSAPSFPHGAIDPLTELSDLALTAGIGLHTDACLGGFVLPFARKLGYDIPPFDFRLPGVTSMSADTHKFGYAAKGTSVVLYRGLERRRYQYFTTTEWPGGLYFSPTFAGSRSGGVIAAGWAAMMNLGEAGYLDATRRILETAAKMRSGIESIPELRLLGNPLFILSFASDSLDIYQVLQAMADRGWSLNGLHKPSCLHVCVTLRHTQEGVAERFVADLKEAVAFAKTNPSEKHGVAPVYGMAASLPLRTLVGDMLTRYMDLLYKV